jgi:cation:H+ antiporter
MLFQILLLAIGLGLLIKGADWLVDGASALARKYNISDLAIGLTIVAFGTSAPELVVNSIASFQNHDAIVFGNVIGSNIFNLFLILGIAGLITPLTVQSSTVWKEIPWSFGAVIILFVLTNDFLGTGTHILTRFDGIILIAFFGLFLFYVYRQLKTDTSKTEIKHKELPGIKIWIFIILGLSLLVIGGQLVVSQGIQLATTLGVSEKIIGLTIIAAGTSLPELATSVVAAFKKNNDIAVGNIIGSNIFNVFLILSVSSFVKPIVYDIKFNTDLYLLAGGTLFLFIAMFTGQKKKLDRWEAGVLLTTFVLYTIYLVAKEV